jgi:hypothetical protein
MEFFMDNAIANKFEKIGARARVMPIPGAGFRVNVLRDDRGEYFGLRCGKESRVDVVDIRPDDRHLLLMSQRVNDRGQNEKSKFLCGHDERHWFVAAVPENASARDVATARDALKPWEVWDSMRRFGVSMKDRDQRKTSGFVRQGEWFFLPRPNLKVDARFVLRNEPIRRGGGKPHMCQELYREGGEQVYVNQRHPNGVTVAAYRALPESERRNQGWRTMRRNARVFVRGKICHSDHATVRLGFWHEVVMNTETRAVAMQQVAFLD